MVFLWLPYFVDLQLPYLFVEARFCKESSADLKTETMMLVSRYENRDEGKGTIKQWHIS